MNTITRMFYDIDFIDNYFGVMINGLSIHCTVNGAIDWDSLNIILPDTLQPLLAEAVSIPAINQIKILAYNSNVEEYILSF